MMSEQSDRLSLTKNWSLRFLKEGNPIRERWALQYLGIDWLIISEFLQSGKDGRCTIGDDLRKFAAEISELREQLVTARKALTEIRGNSSELLYAIRTATSALTLTDDNRQREATSDEIAELNTEINRTMDASLTNEHGKSCQCGITGEGRCPVCLTSAQSNSDG